MPGGLVPTFHFRTLIHSRISHEAPAHTEARPPATLPILYIYINDLVNQYQPLFQAADEVLRARLSQKDPQTYIKFSC